MTYAIDSNIVSYILKGNKVLRKQIIAAGDVVIPLLVYYEIKRGLTAKGYLKLLDGFEALYDGLDIIDLTMDDMNTASEIYATNKRNGTPMSEMDLLIAAQAVARGYTLVTHNVKHFATIDGLAVEDWALE